MLHPIPGSTAGTDNANADTSFSTLNSPKVSTVGVSQCGGPCPSMDELRQVMLGTLDGSRQEICICHLDHCEACQKNLERLATGDCALGRKMERICQHVDKCLPDSGSAYWPALREVEVDLAETFVPELNAIPEALGDFQVDSGSGSSSSGHQRELRLDFLSPPVDPAYLGRLSHFDISRVIGRGGMGVVLEAFDTHLQRPVAIKVLDPELASNDTARQRFCREARTAAAINHEHVVSLHHVERSETNNLPFLVMQLVQGTTLEARITKEHKLPVREVVRIGMQVAAGLAAAHAEGLIHRDVKPANILLENPNGRVKLTDFGLARCVEDVKLTQTGFVTGTPLYMSPEQALGEEVDERSDLFSLGAVMYEMCAGAPPFSGTTPLAILRKITEENARPLQQLNPDVPSWLSEIIGNLLKRKREDRYGSASEVAHLLAAKYQQLERLSPLELPSLAGEGFNESSLTCRQAERRHARHRLFSLVGGILGGTILTFSAMSYWWWQTCQTKQAAMTNGAMVAGIGAIPETTLASKGPVGSPTGVKPTQIFVSSSGPVWGLALTSDGEQLLTAIDDGTIRIWNRQQHRVLGTVQAFSGPVWGVTVTSDGKYFAGGADDGSVKVYNLATRQLVDTFKASGPVRTLQFAPKGHRLAVGTRTGQIEIWDVDTKDKLPIESVHSAGVTAVAWSNDGQYLVSGGGDKMVYLWDAATGMLLLEMSGHNGAIHSVAFSPDNQKIISGGWDKALHIWDTSTGESLGKLEGHTADIWSVVAAPDSDLVASVGEDRVVRFWNLSTMKPVAAYSDQYGTFYSARFTADGKSLIATGRDGITREWVSPKE